MDWTKRYKKAVTFSYDDGNEQDLRLLNIFNQYGIKATFHVNTGLDPVADAWQYGDITVRRLNLREAKDAYHGHEIAVHGHRHLNWTTLARDEFAAEVDENIRSITDIFGTAPVGLSYPYGAYQEDMFPFLTQRGIRYARGTTGMHTFSLQTNLMHFQPTCHHDDPEIFSLAEHFLNSTPEAPQIFYIWGHGYEFEGRRNWSHIERLCDMLAGRDDIFYGTNCEVLLRE